QSASILQALFDAWLAEHPGRHPFEHDELRRFGIYFLGQLSEKSPIAFISGTVGALSRAFDIIRQHLAAGEYDSSFKHRSFSGHRFGEDEFLHFFKSALRQLASEDPTLALEFLKELDPCKHQAILHLHLETISANGNPL